MHGIENAVPQGIAIWRYVGSTLSGLTLTTRVPPCPEAIDDYVTTRRAVMLGSADTLALAASAGAIRLGDHPDQRLIALGAEYDAAEAEMARLETYGDSFPKG